MAESSLSAAGAGLARGAESAKDGDPLANGHLRSATQNLHTHVFKHIYDIYTLERTSETIKLATSFRKQEFSIVGSNMKQQCVKEAQTTTLELENSGYPAYLNRQDPGEHGGPCSTLSRFANILHRRNAIYKALTVHGPTKLGDLHHTY